MIMTKSHSFLRDRTDDNNRPPPSETITKSKQSQSKHDISKLAPSSTIIKRQSDNGMTYFKIKEELFKKKQSTTTVVHDH